MIRACACLYKARFHHNTFFVFSKLKVLFFKFSFSVLRCFISILSLIDCTSFQENRLLNFKLQNV